MPFILRSKNRPGFESYEPEAISAWSEEPDVGMAPVEAWEEVANVGDVLAASPAFGLALPPSPPAEGEHQPLEEPVVISPPVAPEGDIPDA